MTPAHLQSFTLQTAQLQLSRVLYLITQHAICDMLSCKWCWKTRGAAMKKEDYSLIIFTEFPNGRLLSFHSFALNGNWHLGQVLWVMKSEQRFWKSKISVAWRPDWWILQQFMEVHRSVIANRELPEKTIAYIESTRKSKHTRERETHTWTLTHTHTHIACPRRISICNLGLF